MAKKGMPVWGWVLIGCGGITVLGLVVVLGLGVFGFMKAKEFAEDAEKNPAYASVKMMSLINPDIEIVSRDDEKQSVTVRNNQTGEEVTINMEDIEEGRIEWLTEDGSFSVQADPDGDGMTMTSDQGSVTYGSGSKVPDWVPIYPGAGSQGVSHMVSDGTASGSVSYETAATVEEIAEHYRKLMSEEGWELTQTTELGGATYLYFAKGENQSLTVNMGRDGDVTRGMIVYSAPEN